MRVTVLTGLVETVLTLASAATLHWAAAAARGTLMLMAVARMVAGNPALLAAQVAVAQWIGTIKAVRAR